MKLFSSSLLRKKAINAWPQQHEREPKELDALGRRPLVNVRVVQRNVVYVVGIGPRLAKEEDDARYISTVDGAPCPGGGREVMRASYRTTKYYMAFLCGRSTNNVVLEAYIEDAESRGTRNGDVSQAWWSRQAHTPRPQHDRKDGSGGGGYFHEKHPPSCLRLGPQRLLSLRAPRRHLRVWQSGCATKSGAPTFHGECGRYTSCLPNVPHGLPPPTCTTPKTEPAPAPGPQARQTSGGSYQMTTAAQVPLDGVKARRKAVLSSTQVPGLSEKGFKKHLLWLTKALLGRFQTSY
ncbi:hypothetical protein F4604DRAFT_1675956 [Suillus subluteus]|nr:hypothetical protein F4604DRAFT_1675956 [Suillus subluteus]